jgi:8-oxo-dGTP diphosphatase
VTNSGGSTPPGPLHSVSVAAVVLDGHGRALAVRRRDNGHWEPPGGVLELGEAIHDGLRREVEEETGLLVAHPRRGTPSP